MYHLQIYYYISIRSDAFEDVLFLLFGIVLPDTSSICHIVGDISGIERSKWNIENSHTPATFTNFELKF